MTRTREEALALLRSMDGQATWEFFDQILNGLWDEFEDGRLSDSLQSLLGRWLVQAECLASATFLKRYEVTGNVSALPDSEVETLLEQASA